MKSYIYQDNLQSERLITRKVTEADIETWEEFFEDSEATEFLYLTSYGLNSSHEFSTLMINKQLMRYAEQRYGLQAVIDKKSKELIGLCGLLTQEVDGKTEIEVGYHMLKKYWGQGYATEAAKIFINFAFKNELTESVISLIDVRNIRSQKVAEKNGLAIDKTIKWLGKEVVFIYRIQMDNWLI